MIDNVTSLHEYIVKLNQKVDSLDNEIGTMASGGYKPAGSIYFENLPALDNNKLGYTYNIKDSFVTTSDFMEGAGKSYPAGTSVAIIIDGIGNLKYDTLAPFIDIAAIYRDIDKKQAVILSEEIAGASTVEEALKAINEKIKIDSELSINSENAVQNKVIKNALDEKLDKDGKAANSVKSDYATKAMNDAHDRNIVNTYATKEDLKNNVKANPPGGAQGTLNSISINGKKYNVPSGGGGGGTDVEANPPDAATDILSKLKVAGTTYSVQGGGGSTPIVNNEKLIFS